MRKLRRFFQNNNNNIAQLKLLIYFIISGRSIWVLGQPSKTGLNSFNNRFCKNSVVRIICGRPQSYCAFDNLPPGNMKS